MHPRYSRREATAIWSQDTKYSIWFEIEAYACEAMARAGTIPSSASDAIWKNGLFPYTAERMERIEAIEKETKHDVLAFLTELSQRVGPQARYIHHGLTSSDIVDTAFSVQLKRATDLLLQDVDRLLSVLKAKAIEHKDTLTVGRSHGMYGEPTLFGLKMARFYAEFDRNRKRLKRAQEEISICMLSGAMGTFAHLDVSVEAYVAEKLGLRPEPLSTQVIPRDRHAFYFATLAVLASSVENICVEIRHLQRSDVQEVEENFSVGQKGSSAMPHKRNPVLTENMTGLARLVRSAAIPALENVSLWHERDISHSSVERVMAPDTTVTLDFILCRLSSTIENLVVYPDVMRKNLERSHGTYHSQSLLLALTQAGMSREEAYGLVQAHAMKALRDKRDLVESVRTDQRITSLLAPEFFDSLAHLDSYKNSVDTLFSRVFDA